MRTLHPKKFMNMVTRLLPLWYVVALVDRGVIDPAIVKRGNRPARVQPIGLAYLLLIDELAVLIARKTITPEECAEAYETIRARLDELWTAVIGGQKPTIAIGPSFESRIDLTFLRRAADLYRTA